MCWSADYSSDKVAVQQWGKMNLRLWFNLVTAVYKKPTANIIFNCEGLNVFSLKPGTGTGCLCCFPTTSFWR